MFSSDTKGSARDLADQTPQATLAASEPWMNCRSRCLIGLLLALIAGGVYVLTLHPGVGDGDAAELQFCSPILGICHSPGYPFVVLAGKLFTLLPLGGDAAWRVNVMTAFFGVLGVLFLYGAIA